VYFFLVFIFLFDEVTSCSYSGSAVCVSLVRSAERMTSCFVRPHDSSSELLKVFQLYLILRLVIGGGGVLCQNMTGRLILWFVLIHYNTCCIRNSELYPYFQRRLKKVKLSLCLTKHHTMKTYWGSGGIDPRIL
jgi:hypothetical protein